MSIPTKTEEIIMGSLNHGYVQINIGAEIRALKTHTVVAELSLEIDGDEYRPDLSVYPKLEIDFSQDQLNRIFWINLPSIFKLGLNLVGEYYLCHVLSRCFILHKKLKPLAMVK